MPAKIAGALLRLLLAQVGAVQLVCQDVYFWPGSGPAELSTVTGAVVPIEVRIDLVNDLIGFGLPA
jgi:hypothetical protein